MARNFSRQCIRCGKCCKTIKIYLSTPLTESEKDVFRYKGGIINDNVIIFEKSCKFLTENSTCSIYDERPQYCRDFVCEED